MIKEELMNALKGVINDYNKGMGANAAIVKAAKAADFNDKQTDRLVEMLNTTLALKKEQGNDDPTGSCELASKEAVAKMLMNDCSSIKSAESVKSDSLQAIDYLFYSKSPIKTNATIEARNEGVGNLVKAAMSTECVPDELDISQGCLFDAISKRIDIIKSAGESANDVVRGLQYQIEADSEKIAKAIDGIGDNPENQDIADMFKVACEHYNYPNALKSVAAYSTKLAASDGGRYAKLNIFDDSPVSDLLKQASTLEEYIVSVPEYERKRNEFMSKAAEVYSELASAVGLDGLGCEKKASLADFFDAGAIRTVSPANADGNDKDANPDSANLSIKVAELIRKSGISAEDVGRLADDLEKDAVAMPKISPIIGFDTGDVVDSLRAGESLPEEERIILNTRRAILLSDLMANDPIIRDADPNVIAEAYKTMVMTSPRVSLDKSQTRAFLRAAANSVAISPNDAKVLADVDRGMSVANVQRLTSLDSSIKDSNLV